MERLTPKHGWNNACYDTWEVCGLDNACKRDCWKPEPCKIPKMLYRLAEYEGTGLTPEEVTAQRTENARLCTDLKRVTDILRGYCWACKYSTPYRLSETGMTSVCPHLQERGVIAAGGRAGKNCAYWALREQGKPDSNADVDDRRIK